MYAIRQHTFGPADTLRYEQVDDPAPGPGQVRIAVAAAGVHLIDTVIRAGNAPPSFGRITLPMIPGREVAGVVDALGDGVAASWLGRRVVTHLGLASGGYATLAVRDVAALHPIPDNLAEDAAVAMIGTGRTTMSILAAAHLAPDDVALVTAAAGGIGNLLVQEARHVGATVVGLAGGAAKVAQVRQLGADIAIDYREPGWADAVREALGDRRITVAFDSVGGDIGQGTLTLLGPGSRLIPFGWSSGTPTTITTIDVFGRGITVTALAGPGSGQPASVRDLETRALAAAASGRLVPRVQRYPLDQAAAAHHALETRATTGKTLLMP